MKNITQKDVREALKGEDWRLDKHNPAWEFRDGAILDGALSFRFHRHTGTKERMYEVRSPCTGDGKLCDTFREAVSWANTHQEAAVRARAAEQATQGF